jgi:ABC-type uncharacterized transport system substrate-binding protein
MLNYLDFDWGLGMRAPRPVLMIILTIGLLATPLAAEAQPAAKAYRVGYLGAGQITPFFEAFRAGLREHGYVEGRNVALESRWAEGKNERLGALAAELFGLPVDVLVVGTTQGALVAKAASQTTPIVFVGLGDPVGAGLVASLARPGGNVTGLSLISPGLLCLSTPPTPPMLSG